MRRLTIIVTLLAALTSASLSVAQTRIPDYAAKPPSNTSARIVKDADAVRVMNDFAACVVKRSRRGVEVAFSMIPATAEYFVAVVKLMTSDCLDAGELRFKPSLIRGPIFEQLYRTDAKLLKLQDLQASPAVDYQRGATAPYSSEAQLYLGLMDFADCVVRAVPHGADKLVTSRVATAAEAAAFAQLKPSFEACLTNGVELSFSKPMLRGVVSEALYRLSATNAGFPMFAKKN